MKEKIMYAVVGCKGEDHNTDATCDSLVDQKIDSKDIMVYSKTEKTVSSIKNEIIEAAKSKGYNYVFIIENDVLVKDVSAFDKYVKLMTKYKLGIVFYGYHGISNRVLNFLPNPAISVKIDNETTQDFIRFPSDAVIGIDVVTNHQRFDEKFNALEFNEYLKRCHEYKLVPFSGFYFDIEDSWKYFGYTQGKALPKILDRKLIDEDRKYVNENKEKMTLVMENDANKLLEYLSNCKGK